MNATQAKDRFYGQIAVSPKKLGYGSRRGVDSDKKVSIGTCKGNCQTPVCVEESILPFVGTLDVPLVPVLPEIVSTALIKH
jgi:hypothetical protein